MEKSSLIMSEAILIQSALYHKQYCKIRLGRCGAAMSGRDDPSLLWTNKGVMWLYHFHVATGEKLGRPVCHVGWAILRCMGDSNCGLVRGCGLFPF